MTWSIRDLFYKNRPKDLGEKLENITKEKDNLETDVEL